MLHVCKQIIVTENNVKPPPHITLPLVDKIVTDGKSVTFECCVSSNGQMEITWYKGWSYFSLDTHLKVIYRTLKWLYFLWKRKVFKKLFKTGVPCISTLLGAVFNSQSKGRSEYGYCKVNYIK